MKDAIKRSKKLVKINRKIATFVLSLSLASSAFGTDDIELLDAAPKGNVVDLDSVRSEVEKLKHALILLNKQISEKVQQLDVVLQNTNSKISTISNISSDKTIHLGSSQSMIKRENTEPTLHVNGFSTYRLDHEDHRSQSLTIGTPGGWPGLFLKSDDKRSNISFDGKAEKIKLYAPQGLEVSEEISFPRDQFGGGGDKAWISYSKKDNTVEDTKLTIGNNNDENDAIVLHQNGLDRLIIEKSKVTIPAKTSLKVEGDVLGLEVGLSCEPVSGGCGRDAYNATNNNVMDRLDVSCGQNRLMRKIDINRCEGDGLRFDVECCSLAVK